MRGIIEDAETGTDEYGKVKSECRLTAQLHILLVICAIEEPCLAGAAIELRAQINHCVDGHGGFRDRSRLETIYRSQRILSPDELFLAVFHVDCDISVRVLLYGQTGHVSFLHVL